MFEDVIGSIILGALATIAILVVVFLIIRQLVLWYFRINERTEFLKTIDHNLRMLRQELAPPYSTRLIRFICESSRRRPPLRQDLCLF